MAIVFHTFYLKIYNYINKHMMLIMKLTWHLVNLFIPLRAIEVFFINSYKPMFIHAGYRNKQKKNLSDMV